MTIFVTFIQSGASCNIFRSILTAVSLSLSSVALLISPSQAWSASQTRTTAFEYDAKGLLVKEIIEPSDPNLCVVTSYAYNTSSGNRESSTTRNCTGILGKNPGINDEAVAPTGVAVFAGRTTTYTYTDDARFVKTVTNALGHIEAYEYTSLGAVTRLTDPNVLATEWQYDKLGRKILQIQAYESGATTTVGTKFEYLLIPVRVDCQPGYTGSPSTTPCPSKIVGPTNASGTAVDGVARYAITSTPVSIATATKIAGEAIGPYNKVYYDALNRPIRTETQGFDGSGTASTIYKDTVYDNRGQVIFRSRPYNKDVTGISWETTEYDSLGRITKSEFLDDQGAKQADTTTYDGLITTAINAKGQKTIRVNNSQGQTYTNTDPNGKVLIYIYDAFGNLTKTAVQGQEAITATTLAYDLRGRKTSMVDPDMGTWIYTYNALGEMVNQTDAKGQVTSLSYDTLGRMTKRVESDLISNWYYDKYGNRSACNKGLGKLCQATSDNGYNRTHTYDNLGRSSKIRNVIDKMTYDTSTTYDSINGRITSQTYPTGKTSNPTSLITKFVYTKLGYLKELRNGWYDTLYWQADSMDAEGRLTQQTSGNGVQTIKNFNPYTGRTKGITAGSNMGVLNLAYTYDSLGNVVTRQDTNQSLSETFTNDSLNRLTSASVNANATGWVTTNYAYNELGNLICKSNLGVCSATAPNMTYNASAYNGANQATRTIIHAVASVVGTVHGTTNPTYQYDLNGNMTSGAGFSISNTSFNMVKQITHASKDGVSYLYGSEHQRIREQILTAGTLTAKETTIYLHPDMTNGLFFERRYIGTPNTANSKYIDTQYLTAGGQVVAINQSTWTLSGTLTPFAPSTDVNQIRYLHRDALGSVVAVTNSAAQVMERYAYDPFGKRRYPNGTTDPLDTIRTTYTDRGFTNHEHVDALGLINMNGRFYDPTLGRFVSADLTIQDSDNLQSYNRYSYTMNNPLNLTDPSGYTSIGDGGVDLKYSMNLSYSSDYFNSSKINFGPSTIGGLKFSDGASNFSLNTVGLGYNTSIFNPFGDLRGYSSPAFKYDDYRNPFPSGIGLSAMDAATTAWAPVPQVSTVSPLARAVGQGAIWAAGKIDDFNRSEIGKMIQGLGPYGGVQEMAAAKASMATMLWVGRLAKTETTLDLLSRAERLSSGALRVDAATLNRIGAAEARGGKAFSGLEAKVMQDKPATWQGQLTGGRQTVIKYLDPATGQTRFTVHTVTDGSGLVVHRDFDSVLIRSGQQVVK